jgi:3-deoxy-D-manno-octulosonic-acid transferase
MNLVYRAAARLFHLVPLPPGKLADARTGRRGAAARWTNWASDTRSETPLVWFHAASVGESQVVVPIAALVRDRHPSWQTVLTYSSPSVAAWPHPHPVDRTDYAPAELPSAMADVFRALRPTIVVVSRGDLWPEMVAGASAWGVPVAVVGGAVGPHSARLRWPVSALLGTVHRRLAFVGVPDADEVPRWVRLGARREAVHVTGDPRDDYLLEHTPREAVIRPLARWASAGTVMVAGSTHAPDEEVLIDAFAKLVSRASPVRLMVVPHAPRPFGIARLLARARDRGIDAATWDGSEEVGDAQLLIVSRTGVLSDLYGLADIAYVGGGFGTKGVHSVAEPAALGVPVVAGPAVLHDPAARRFVQARGARAIRSRYPVRDLVRRWAAWLDHPEARAAAGRAARDQLHSGAAAASVIALEGLLGV